MRITVFLSTLLTALCLAMPAMAEPYLDPETIPPTVLNAPPAEKSVRWTSDVNDILTRQKHAIISDIQAAASEHTLTPEMIAIATDATLTRETHPALYHLLDRIGDTTRAVTGQAKKYWNTKRPYLMDARIKPLIDAHMDNAYPSGHTSMGYTLARALGMLMPEKHEAFLDRADTIAQHRVLVGMHYPSDIEAGRELSLIIFGGLLQNEEFQHDLQAAREELNPAAQN